MNLNVLLFGNQKKIVVACSIFISLAFNPQSIRAQTSAATNAVQFSNGGIVAPSEPDLPPPWTAEMWVNRANASGASAALFNSSTAGLKLEQFGSPNRNVGITIYGVNDYYFNYTAPTNTWTHLTFVGTSSGVSLYVNGVLTDSLAVPISLPLSQFGNLATDFLNATVDEVSVWNIARSASAIQSSYQFPTTNSQPGLILLWHFDETSGFVATDSSGNNYNGVINEATRVTSTAPIYLRTIIVDPFLGPSIPQAVSIANGIGNMIINFVPDLAGTTRGPPELDITNNMTIDGSGLSSPLTLMGGGARLFAISPSVNVTITGINLSSGLAQSGYPTNSMGGAISNAGNLTLNNMVFSQNQAIGTNGPLGGGNANGTAGEGGAIYNSSTGTLTINQCTFAQNTATGGNGLSKNSLSGNGGNADGGAIYNSGRLTANFSTFYGQTNTGGLAAQVSGSGDTSVSGSALGGAIYNDTLATATINECTLVDNTLSVPGAAKTVGSARGGAIYSTHSLAINQSTFASNILTGTGGATLSGGSVCQTGMATIFNSILGPDSVPQNLGTYSSPGTNLIDGAPLLAPLANYGGSTLTMPLMHGSAGIDAGADSALNSFATDQRGYPRLYGAHVDIGAVESAPPVLTNFDTTGGAGNRGTGTFSIQLTVTVSASGAPCTVTFESGGIPFGGGTFSIPGSATPTNLTFTADFGRGYAYNLSVVGSNIMGSSTQQSQLFLPPFSTDVLGDYNDDGIIEPGELMTVYQNYLATSPYLLITNAIGLGQSNVTFAISNGISAVTYTVQASTDLVNWTNLGKAGTTYNFTDTNAPAAPNRYYRLVYP